jgi:hypothetical protein
MMRGISNPFSYPCPALNAKISPAYEIFHLVFEILKCNPQSLKTGAAKTTL